VRHSDVIKLLRERLAYARRVGSGGSDTAGCGVNFSFLFCIFYPDKLKRASWLNQFGMENTMRTIKKSRQVRIELHFQNIETVMLPG
jgi:hypothetical protein